MSASSARSTVGVGATVEVEVDVVSTVIVVAVIVVVVLLVDDVDGALVAIAGVGGDEGGGATAVVGPDSR